MPFYDGAPFELAPNRQGHPRVALTLTLKSKIHHHAEDADAEPAVLALCQSLPHTAPERLAHVHRRLLQRNDFFALLLPHLRINYFFSCNSVVAVL